MRAESHNATDRPLKKMFDSVPRRYDLLNRLLTLGMDARWRRRAARRCLAGRPGRVLDLCCGTGLLALQLARRAAGAVEIVGLDFSPAMLAAARRKLAASRSPEAVRYVEGDASDMDFPDGHFDAVGIGFGFRNLTWRNPLGDRALAEVRRVLRPGGRLVIVETSQPRGRIVRAGFHTFMRTIVPTVGGRLSKQPDAYRYLAESVVDFHDAEAVSALLVRAGFQVVEVRPLMGGVAAIHVAES